MGVVQNAYTKDSITGFNIPRPNVDPSKALPNCPVTAWKRFPVSTFFNLDSALMGVSEGRAVLHGSNDMTGMYS